jgi:hypothetical protein
MVLLFLGFAVFMNIHWLILLGTVGVAGPEGFEPYKVQVL